jgi:CO/xanthine dehydrogenase FAD-binding subunit
MAPSAEARIFSPQNLPDALSAYARNPDALIYSGGTEILKDSNESLPELRGTIICVSNIPELKILNRSERYVDLGAALSLTELIEAGERIIPACIVKTARAIAHPGVRNLATLGGNLAVKKRRMDMFAALACLDAQAELRKEGGSRWTPVSLLFSGTSEQGILPGEIICRIRIPLDNWDLSLSRKIGNRVMPDESSYTFIFLAKTSRGVVSDVRVAFSGHSYFRRRELENSIIGKALPLDREDAMAFLSQYRAAVDEVLIIPTTRRIQFMSMLEWALGHLSE